MQLLHETGHMRPSSSFHTTYLSENYKLNLALMRAEFWMACQFSERWLSKQPERDRLQRALRGVWPQAEL